MWNNNVDDSGGSEFPCLQCTTLGNLGSVSIEHVTF